MNPELFRFSTVLEVRWRDLDALGHVNNAVYFTYLEQARVHYLREVGLPPITPDDIGFILAEASCTYRAPLTMGERVTIWVRASRLGRSSFHFEYRMEGEDGRLAATAHSAQVCYDYRSGQTVPLPSHWRDALVAYEPGLGGDGETRGRGDGQGVVYRKTAT